MHFKKEHIITLLQRIISFSERNLKGITEAGIDTDDELDNFFSGMIVRQYAILSDIKILFEFKKGGYLTSEMILFRCIADDFIHIRFLVSQQNVEDEVIRFNADAINKNFSKLAELATLNEEKLGGNYPEYPTYASMEDLKEKIKQAPKRQEYFIDKDNFRFKTFKSTGNLIRDLQDSGYSHSLRRAYFIWRKLSDHVHYSSFSHEEVLIIDPEKDHTYTEFAEIIYYSYCIIIDCMKHFQSKYGLAAADDDNLAEYYKGAGH
ncbi:hypothetical protein EYY60_16485 [Flavobacterium zhairuonense]|uniref:DUF5677 domain-containing protein n=1 Tax=Flavobacterium zhairuonense TaxID=2493631 RepID=UPI0010473B64|nr:DUF5677 domain-containing protein [Flavobacterium zhairuonense]KAF2508718.1 hypothetical protein EYY60_16485 [Flavobacterium zhairuonense]